MDADSKDFIKTETQQLLADGNQSVVRSQVLKILTFLNLNIIFQIFIAPAKMKSKMTTIWWKR